MYKDRSLERELADIISPQAEVIANRYSNKGYRVGSKVVNNVPCPYCEAYLANNCKGCPLDQSFGQDDSVGYDGSGCKVVIQKLWGDFTFGDYASKIVRAKEFNPQLQQINEFVNGLISIQSIVRIR